MLNKKTGGGGGQNFNQQNIRMADVLYLEN